MPCQILNYMKSISFDMFLNSISNISSSISGYTFCNSFHKSFSINFQKFFYLYFMRSISNNQTNCSISIHSNNFIFNSKVKFYNISIFKNHFFSWNSMNNNIIHTNTNICREVINSFKSS